MPLSVALTVPLGEDRIPISYGKGDDFGFHSIFLAQLPQVTHINPANCCQFHKNCPKHPIIPTFVGTDEQRNGIQYRAQLPGYERIWPARAEDGGIFIDH